MFEKKTNNTEDGFATEFTNDGFNNGGFAQGQQNYAPQGQPMYQGQVKPKKKGKTTKTVLIVLGVIFALLVCCCGGGYWLFASTMSAGAELVEESLTTDYSGSGFTKLDEEGTMGIDFEDVVVDNKDFKITFTRITDEFIDGTSLNVTFENKGSTKPIMFALEKMAVNGVEIPTFYAESVASKKKSVETIGLLDSILGENGIFEYTDIMVTFDVYEEDNRSTDETIVTHIYPYGEENKVVYEREPLETDNVIVDNKYATITVLGEDADAFWGHEVDLYITNNCDKDIYINVESVSVNGYMTEPWFISHVGKGYTRYDAITLSESDIEDTGISEVNNLEFTLEIRDDDSSKLLYEEKIVLQK